MTESVQLILDDSAFNKSGFDEFLNEANLAACGNDYQVVAIMGPQSSGKSTLMNHLFKTSFREMDAMSGRGQTTRGVWLAKSPAVPTPTTLVMDLEGNDGRERGEDDTNFERQSALFALAVSDILMVNIWCHDIGREHGAGKPLMKTILQVNLKLFGKGQRRRTVLLFVIRDRSKTPLTKLVEVLAADLEAIWDAISKPPEFQDAKLTDLFDVQYTALAHYEERHADFLADVNFLGRRFDSDSAEENSLVRVDEHRLPANSLSLSMQQIWGIIQSQKDLNLPAHKVMVANIRCQEIKDDQLRRLADDQAWYSLSKEAAEQLVPDFGARASTLLDSCITGYEADAMYFDNGVRLEKRGELVQQLLALIRPLHERQLALLADLCVATFEQSVQERLAAGGQFAAVAVAAKDAGLEMFSVESEGVVVHGSGWAVDAEVEQLQAKLATLVAGMVDAKTKDVVSEQQRNIGDQLSGPVLALLEEMPTDLWPQLHALVDRTVSSATASALRQLEGYEAEGVEGAGSRVAAALREAGELRLESHLKEASHLKLSRMKDRFHEAFNMDATTGTPRTWTARVDIPAIAREARGAAANVLMQLAFVRDRSTSYEDAEEAVEEAVQQLLQGHASRSMSTSTSMKSRSGDEGAATSFLATSGSPPRPRPSTLFHIAAATAWPSVPKERVLLKPEDMRVAWREFMSASNVSIQQAELARQNNILANKKQLPVWALVAMLALGFNEITALLYSPIYLVLGLLAFLFLRTLYSELDVDAEMQKGALPGALSLAAKFRPAFGKVLANTFDSTKKIVEEKVIELQERRAAAAEPGAAGSSAHPSGAGLTQRRAAGSSSSPTQKVSWDPAEESQSSTAPAYS